MTKLKRFAKTKAEIIRKVWHKNPNHYDVIEVKRGKKKDYMVKHYASRPVKNSRIIGILTELIDEN